MTAALAVSAALMLSACGNNGSQTKQNSETLHLSIPATLETLDISKSEGFGQTGNVFESFYRLGKKGKPSLGLAKSSHASKNGLIWTFKLRKAKWSNGDPITAHDFVYSWRRSLNPKTASPYAYLFNGVKNANAVMTGKKNPSELGISAPNKSTVVIKLNKPIAYFKVLMAYPLFGPQDQKVVQKYGKKFGTKASYQVYSGPFKVVGWNGTNDTWSFVKNKNYWDKSKVKLNKITYQVTKSNDTGYQLYEQKKLDMVPLDSTQVKNLKNRPGFKEYPYAQIEWAEYNCKAANPQVRKALNNRDIRLALSLSLDRQILVKKVLGNGSTLPNGFVPAKLAYDPKNGEDFAQQELVKNTVDYNPSLAKKDWQKGMKAIGLKKLNVSLLSSDEDPVANPVGQYLQSQWTRELKGISVKINSIPAKSSDSRGDKGQYEIYLDGWGGDYNDPMTFMQIPLKNTSYNSGKWNNNQYNILVNRANDQNANNPEKRWHDLVKAARIVNSEQPFTPIFQQTQAYMKNNKVHGIVHNTAGTQWDFKYTYIK